MAQSLFYLTILTIISVAYCTKCTNPEVTSKSFTTEDATIVGNIAYISEFSVKCGSGAVTQLYADRGGNIAPVSIVGNNLYQVSWTEDTKTAKSGDITIRLFDEDGYTALRKAIRAEEDLSSVPALFEVILNHPGSYYGSWIDSNLFALIVSILVAYAALALGSEVVNK